MENAFILFFVIFYLAIITLMVVAMWKIFVKSGKPGWAVLVPFYNLYIYTQIIQRPGWWMLLYFLVIIPILGSITVLIISILDYVRLSRLFGKNDGFAVGLIFLSFIFIPILAFGDAQYQGAGPAKNDDLLDQ